MRRPLDKQMNSHPTDARAADTPRRIEAAPAPAPLAYTIATLVTDPAQYDAMRDSFLARGFGGQDCEFLLIDNTGPAQTSAYAGLNAALREARGAVVILCHQDVRLIGDGRAELDARLAELEGRDPAWAVAGNAGATGPGRLALSLTDPHGRSRRIGDLPARVESLDENLLIVRRAAGLRFSRDLDGFHFYGTDLVLQAEAAGWTAYVIDFHLEHLSPGRKDASFDRAAAAFRAKWSHVLRPRWLQTTCTLLRLDGARVSRRLGTMLEPLAGRIARRLPGASGWSGPPPRARRANGG